MGYFLVYILKSSLCLAAFYLFYKLLLSRDTFHRFNRVVLLSIFMLAVIIPWINIPANKDFSYPAISLNIEHLLELANFNEQSNSVNDTSHLQLANLWASMVTLLYLAGVAVTLLFSLISMIMMMRMLSGKGVQKIKTENSVIIIIHKEKTAPFSWMKYIAIAELDYKENGKEIICHEMAHIKGRHSLDLILCEIVKSLHWFNPASWLLKRELKNIHEYQADNAVILEGTNAQQYQLLLIKKAVGDRLYTIANSFNHSKLKNRITMISKRRSNLWATLKVLYVLPLSLVAVAAFATEEVSLALAPVSEFKITDFIQTDTTKTKKRTIEIKATKKEVKVSGSSHHDTLFIIKSAGDTSKISIKKEINVFVYDSDTLKNHKFKNNSDSNVKVAAFTSKSGDSVNVIVFVDGVEKDIEIIKQIDSKDIKEVKVFKGSKAVTEYGQRAKNGVIVVTTKKENSAEIKLNDEKVIVKMSDKDANPLYVIDGVIQEKATLDKIDPKTISSIKVLKGDAAINEYGDRGKQGVVIITLKK
ncbi:MAG: M56 family metallopeptidase [Bacteroidales bacterium]|nr:M56 family metallopeptidase [Bacteroidales bacterium]